MKFLVPVGGITDGVFGIITAPNHRGIPAGIKAGLPWAADVGCLSGPAYVKKADIGKTLDWLAASMMQYQSQCLFIAGFDVVGNAIDTLDAYQEFARYFSAGGWPLAYVVQNGAELLPIPEDVAAIFLGGDTEYKESMTAVSVIKRAQATGKHIHIGRVNWKRRYDLFSVLEGSENFTCDGTRTRYDGTEKTMRAWQGYESQRPLIVI